MKLSKRAEIALKKSIKHWQDDIIERFEKNDEIIIPNEYPVWKSNYSNVKCYKEHCTLCILFYERGKCTKCPYYKFYKEKCYLKHWILFINNLNSETALAMKKSLEAILESSKRKKP